MAEVEREPVIFDADTKQGYINEIQRLRRVNEQQASGWKVCAQKLRAAEVYIQMLEDESDILLQRIAELENGGDVNEEADPF